jgi:predicted Holliday junction resolvase-like endonuclease
MILSVSTIVIIFMVLILLGIKYIKSLKRRIQAVEDDAIERLYRNLKKKRNLSDKEIINMLIKINLEKNREIDYVRDDIDQLRAPSASGPEVDEENYMDDGPAI